MSNINKQESVSLYSFFPGQILRAVISHDFRTTWQRAAGELRREAARQHHRLLSLAVQQQILLYRQTAA